MVQRVEAVGVKGKWRALVARRAIEIAVDTEFAGAETLTIQVATRTGDREITVQVYYAQLVHDPTAPRDGKSVGLSNVKRRTAAGDRIVVRPPRPIPADLSPVGMIRDLFGIRSIAALSRTAGRRRVVAARNSAGSATLAVDRLVVTFVGHFLPADLGRICGVEFSRELFADRSALTHEGPVVLRAKPCLGFAADGAGSRRPVVEYAEDRGGKLTAIEFQTFDTNGPFDEGSLDELCRTFLGRGKRRGPTRAQRRDMIGFLRAHPGRAYAYAIEDAVLTLQLVEAMRREHRRVFEAFGVEPAAIPPMGASLGRRGTDFLRVMAMLHIGPSARLASPREFRELVRRGGRDHLGAPPGPSRFGAQTASCHGGLLFNRTQGRLWHEAPGMIRDVDGQGFYNQITREMNVYLGEPLVLEPGEGRLTLEQAVAFLEANCPRDGWFVRVTGDIQGWENTLIPSTVGATTYENWRQHARRPPGSVPDLSGRLYTGRIESGVVTAATWDVIRCLPAGLRRQYEGLVVASIVCYPNQLIAADGKAYDDLVAQLGRPTLPWSSTWDFAALREVTVRPFTADHVSLRFPLREVATRTGDLRREARRRGDAGQERCWKLLGNVLYGVLAGRGSVGNVVASNVITAAGRAAAFALVHGLNGFQVVTDGCTYRRDQIPRISLAECLELQPDYPTRRADETGTIPFYTPAEVPEGDEEFTTWFRDHLRRFLGPAAGSLVARFAFEHKRHGDRPAFDALVCDGPGNDIKLAAGTGPARWTVLKATRRGYGAAARAAIARWLVPVAEGDQFAEPAPLVPQSRLLGAPEATRLARRFLQEHPDHAVLLPLGAPFESVLRVRLITPTSFLYANPEQERLLTRQIELFRRRYGGLGLEILTLRRTYGDRRGGSLVDLLAELLKHIRSGCTALTGALHLRRKFTAAIERQLGAVVAEQTARNEELRREFEERMAFDPTDPRRPRVGIWCASPADLPRVQKLREKGAY